MLIPFNQNNEILVKQHIKSNSGKLQNQKNMDQISTKESVLVGKDENYKVYINMVEKKLDWKKTIFSCKACYKTTSFSSSLDLKEICIGYITF
jgi:hypothetical protein